MVGENDILFFLKMNSLVGILLLVLFTTTVFAKYHRKKFHKDDPPRCEGDRDSPCFQCLYFCLFCVGTWGKRQYDGHACAMGRRSSNGENKDEDCSKHMKTGGSSHVSSKIKTALNLFDFV